MKVLFVTNMYPGMKGVDEKFNKYYGIHVKQQIQSLEKYENIESYIYKIEGAFSKFEYLKSVFKVPLVYYRFKPKVIHIHFGLSALFLFLTPWLANKTVITFHGCDILQTRGHLLTRIISKYAQWICKKVIYVSENMKPHISNPNKYHISCGVDADVFKPKPVKDVNKQDVKLVFPGNPNRHVKNYPLFENVLEILNKRNLDTTFTHSILNGLTPEQVAESLGNSYGILLTSHSEGSPQVVKEALLMNKYVFSAPVGDVDKYQDYDNVFISEHHDAEQLAALVESSISVRKNSIDSRTKFLKLGLDNESISSKVHSLYVD